MVVNIVGISTASTSVGTQVHVSESSIGHEPLRLHGTLDVIRERCLNKISLPIDACLKIQKNRLSLHQKLVGCSKEVRKKNSCWSHDLMRSL